MDLPRLLKEAREKKGWSQAKLAEELNVSPGTVGSWESDAASGHGMRPARMKRVARVLGLDLVELIRAVAS